MRRFSLAAITLIVMTCASSAQIVGGPRPACSAFGTTSGTCVQGGSALSAPSITINGGTSLTTYLENTWVPTDASGAGLTFTGVTATYTEIGRLVFVSLRLTYPTTANGSAAIVGGLPFNVGNFGTAAVNSTYGTMFVARFSATTANVEFLAASNLAVTNAQLTGATVTFSGFYSR